ncbi:MAG: T9SS type A sorting domain-containing protein [candidate division Zixibacteria bacterium]|nr:T9SS type A sorting domain-containing protein [candidate division Zixibacteria bacterium]
MQYRYRILLSLIILIASAANSFSQEFVRITDGDFVNDGGISGGVSWIDYDNNGFLDLFVANAQNQVDFLYHNDGGGNLIKITSGDIVQNTNRSSGNCWGDYDNDGDIDLFISSQGGQDNILYRNDGDGNFYRIYDGVIVEDGGDSHHSTWGDYNNDGFLDMFVANGGFTTNGVNFLYRNEGDGSFIKIEDGDLVNTTGRTFGGNWGDYDNDGDVDIFVAHWNDEDNNLYRNDGIDGFVALTEGDIVHDGGSSIGSNWGDYDNDGDLDLFVANWGDQDNFLYQNNGNGTFTAITDDVVVSDGGQSWCGCWGDYDNDGDLDLFVTNYDQDNFLYSNDGDGSFTKIIDGEIVNDRGLSSGAACCDYDNDGDLDLFIANWVNQDNYFYENIGNGNNWINIRCIGIESNTSAIGAKVRIKAVINGNSYWQLREITSNAGLRSQNSLNAEFGLGDAMIIDSLVIEWPSGIIDSYDNISGNRFITAVEDDGYTSVVNDNSEHPIRFIMLSNYPNPFNSSTNIRYLLNEDSSVKLEIYNLQGQKIALLFEGYQRTGFHQVKWNANDFTSGIYFYKLSIGNNSSTKRMLLLK